MEIITIDKTRTIAFTGHRSINQNEVQLKDELTTILTEQYNNGYRAFITGAAKGFDLICAEAVLSLQKIYSDIQLFCVVPYAGHHHSFTDEDKQRYIDIANKATSNIILSHCYYDGCFLRRNDYMIDNCSLLIAYYNYSFRSGTGYTVRKAIAKNIPIINLYK